MLRGIIDEWHTLYSGSRERLAEAGERAHVTLVMAYEPPPIDVVEPAESEEGEEDEEAEEAEEAEAAGEGEENETAEGAEGGEGDLEAMFEELLDEYGEEADAGIEQLARARTMGLVGGVGGSALSVVAALLIGAVLTKSVTEPLERSVDYAEAVAEGNLAVTFSGHTNDEFGRLTRSVEAMKESLVKRLDDLMTVAATVGLAAENVQDTASDLAARADALREAPGVDDVQRAELEAFASSARELAKRSENLRSALGVFES